MKKLSKFENKNVLEHMSCRSTRPWIESWNQGPPPGCHVPPQRWTTSSLWGQWTWPTVYWCCIPWCAKATNGGRSFLVLSGSLIYSMRQSDKLDLLAIQSKAGRRADWRENILSSSRWSIIWTYVRQAAEPRRTLPRMVWIQTWLCGLLNCKKEEWSRLQGLTKETHYVCNGPGCGGVWFCLPTKEQNHFRDYHSKEIYLK